MEPEMMASSGQCAICQSPTFNSCAGCKIAFYCCKEHQESDWPKHKPICKLKIKIASSPELGDHWVAARDLPVGFAVISELPKFIMPRPCAIEGMESCMTCCCAFKKDSGVHCNAGCKTLFCSKACATSPIHVENECGIFGRSLGINGKISAFAQRKVKKMRVIQQALVNTNSMMLPFFRGLGVKVKNPGLWAKVMKLAKEVEAPPPGFAPRTDLVASFLPDLDPPIPQEQTEQFCNEMVQFQDILGKFSFTNGYESGTRDAQNNFKPTYWRNFYLKTASISRQCFPNCFVTIGQGPDYRLIVRTQTEVKAGQPLSLPKDDDLIDFMGGVRTQFIRKKNHILSDICSCPRCLDPTELGTMLSAVKCTQCKKGYLLPINPINMDVNAPWMCNEGCLGGLVWDEVDKLVNNLCSKGKKFVKNVPSEGVSLIRVFLDEIRRKLHPNHWALLQIEWGLVLKLEKYSHNFPVSDERSDMHLKMLEHVLEMAKITAPGKSLLRKKYLNFMMSQRSQRVKSMILRKLPAAITQEFMGGNIKWVNECFEMNKIHPYDPKYLSALKKCKAELIHMYNYNMKANYNAKLN